MQLTCPECGKEFEIEESQQAHEKQAAALKAQQEEAKLETQRLLEEQKKQLAKDRESMVEAAVKKQVEDELNESRARLINQAKEEAEQNTQKLLEEQKKQLAKDQESMVEAAVKKQVEENQAAALKEMEQNYQQQFHETLEKTKRDNLEMIERKESQHKIEKDRLTLDIAKLNDRLNRNQAVELVGEAAEERLKEALKERFPVDFIRDIKKGALGADLEQHVNLPGGKNIGIILIERKSTKSFSQTWLPKLKKETEKSNAMIGVIVTDTMPKVHEKKSYFAHSSNILILRSDVAVDMIEILRENLITNFRDDATAVATQDIELTANVFAYIAGEGMKHLEDFQAKLKERKELLDAKDADHNRVMKKEWKNLQDQVDAFQKLGAGLSEASKNKVSPLPPPED
tara:strand:+ start:1643 stop:2845 length:1203 start_codon:yes stop_codon:yes gene_type:complete